MYTLCTVPCSVAYRYGYLIHGRRTSDSWASEGFFQGCHQVDFSRRSQKYISRGGQSDKNSFYPLKTKKTTFFVKNLIGKCQFSNYRGGKPPSPLPTRMVRLFIFLIVWTLQPHFSLRMSAQTLQSLFEGVCMPRYFRTLPGLDQGWTQCPTLNVVLYQLLRVSEQ